MIKFSQKLLSTLAMIPNAKATVFPTLGLLPKTETNAASFLANTGYDGRFALPTILTSGVDPGAAGLKSLTTDGKQKVIQLIDCSGSGDVHMAVVVCDNSVEGTRFVLNENKKRLNLPKDWINPSGVWRLGRKHSSALFCHDLEDRMAVEQKEKFDERVGALIVNVARSSNKEVVDKTSAPDDKQALIDAQEGYASPGEWIDCISYHDGTTYKAAITTTQDFGSSMASYNEAYEYARFTTSSMLNYSFNVYDEGEVVSIVTTAGSHGTHVASITAAHFPDNPELNGVAPGAQIISLKIGDTHLGSMETGRGLLRAATELVRLGVDVANISYGEAVGSEDRGRFVEVLREVVNRGTVVFASGGNAGPALSTVGAPGGTTDCCIGVGAYVTNSMMDAEYNMLARTEQRAFTWSSRGPSVDGDVGVDIYAPGGAITSVPQFNVYKSQLMNGTSMSSPNAAGCMALILSGLKKEGVKYSPYALKAALKHTGRPVGDEMDVKLFQVDATYEHLVSLKDYSPSLLHYNVTVGSGRGVYLRDASETSSMQQKSVAIDVVFPNTKDPEQNLLKVDFEVQLSFEASADWIQTPSFLLLTNQKREFNIRVDPSHLAPGLHFGTISAYDCNRRDAGPLFKIPVTVCKSELPIEGVVKYENLIFTPGDIQRKFIAVPSNANFADFVITSPGRATPGRFLAHLVQLHPQTRYTRFEHEFAFQLVSTGESSTVTHRKSFACVGGLTLEVCLAQFWSTLESTGVSVEIKFRSILASTCSTVQPSYGIGSAGGGELLLNSSLAGVSRIDFSTPVRREIISPKLSFSLLRQTLRSTDQDPITPLKSRDVLPDGKQVHELILTYTVKVAEAGSVFMKVPRFNDQIYDSQLENFAFSVFDANKRLISYQDVYPKAIKLEEGDYTIKLQVCAWNTDLLNDLKSLGLVVEQTLSKPIVPVLSNTVDSIGSGKVKPFLLEKGGRAVVWVGEIVPPKFAKLGDLLVGTLDIVGDGAEKINGTLFTIISPIAAEFKPKEIDLSIKEPPKADEILIETAVRDVEISWMKKIKTDESKLLYIEKMGKKYESFPEYHKERLLALSELATKEKESGVKNLILSAIRLDAASKTLSFVDQDKVAIYQGMQHDLSQNHEKDVELKKLMDLSKELLGMSAISAAEVYQGLIIMKESELVSSAPSSLDALSVASALTLFTGHLSTLASWSSVAPMENGKYLALWAWLKQREGLSGQALQGIQKYLGNVKNSSKEPAVWKDCCDIKVDLLKCLEWNVMSEYEENWKSLRFPKAHIKF